MSGEQVDIMDYIKQLEHLAGGKIDNPTEYMDGMRDFEEGNKFNHGKGEDYHRGYYDIKRGIIEI